MTPEEFSVFASFCVILMFFALVLKIQEMMTPKFAVIKKCHENGFEIRRDNYRVYHHVLDEQKYKSYITRRHNEALEQFKRDRANDQYL